MDDGAPVRGSDPAETPALPNPPPRYKRVVIDDAGTPPSGDEGEASEPVLQINPIHCTGQTPYVCLLDDKSFRCSDRPCVPDCGRIGCLSGEDCLACDGGMRCVPSGDGC